MFDFNKKFGQNFISDSKLIERIINNISIDKNTLVIEVGPGMGALTKFLVDKSGFCLIYEIDGRLEKYLNNLLIGYDNFKLIIDDFMNINLVNEIEKLNYDKIVFFSNLPYYITSPILNKLIDSNIKFNQIVVMTQKEYADKLVNKNKFFGSLGVLINTFYDVKKVFDISKNYFNPKPNVDSSLVVMDINHDNYNKIKSVNVYKKIVNSSFMQKRKSLRNNLKNIITDIDNIINKININSNTRAEDLTIENFIDISNSL